MAVSWEDLLVVANCKIHWKEFANHQVYLCPATPEGFDPKYIHERAKFFAPYVSQGAKYVAQIDGVVRVKSRSDAEILWNNTEEPDLVLVARAFEKLKEAFSYKPPCLVFLLSELKATDLVYDQRGALLASRQYFDVSSLSAKTAGELAQKLREVPWSVLPKHTPTAPAVAAEK